MEASAIADYGPAARHRIFNGWALNLIQWSTWKGLKTLFMPLGIVLFASLMRVIEAGNNCSGNWSF